MKICNQMIYTRALRLSLYFVVLSLLMGCLGGAPERLCSALVSDLPSNTLTFGRWDAQSGVQERSFQLWSEKGVVFVESINIIGDSGKAFEVLTRFKFPFRLEGGKANTIRLSLGFLSDVGQEHQARLEIISRACSGSDVQSTTNVDLRHEKVLYALPVWSCGGNLEFVPTQDGYTSKGCLLTNQGDGDLVVERVRFQPELPATSGEFQWRKPALPLTLKAGERAGALVAPIYILGIQDRQRIRGRFLLTTREPLRPGSPPLELVISVAARGPVQIELVPTYPTCTDDQACRKIDTRFRCHKDAISKSSLCRQSDGQTPLLKFPLTSISKVTKRTFWIRSIGERPLTVDGIAFDANTSKDFRVVTAGVSFPLVLEPKQEKEITVEYAPSDDDKDAGKLIVTSNADENPRAEILVEASDRGCNVQVQPLKLDFRGPISKQVTMINRGNEACLIKKVFLKSGLSEPFQMLPTPLANQVLAPNGSFSLLVKFAPSINSENVDFLVIESDDPDEPTIEVELDGGPFIEWRCELQATLTILNFGIVAVGRSRKSTVTFANQGFRDCDVTSINVLGTDPAGNAAFILNSAVKIPLIIKSGANLRLEVSFKPAAERSVYEGKLEIQSNSYGPNEVKLVGSALVLCLDIRPSDLDFGRTKFGCAAPTRRAEIIHTGAARCPASIAVTGYQLTNNPNGEFRINSAPIVPRTLTAGQSIQVGLAYKAKDLGADTATLEIANSVPGQSPLALPLLGEGVSTSDWKDVYKQSSSAPQRAYILGRTAVATTIIVKANGQLIKEDAQSGWQYDATNNSVTFASSAVPGGSAVIEIVYKAVCLP